MSVRYHLLTRLLVTLTQLG